MSDENPFKLMEESMGNIVVPFFKKEHTIHLKLSDEALTQLFVLAKKFDFHLVNPTMAITELLEALGTYQLEIVKPIEHTDKESGLTTEDCRQAGYEDGLEGNPNMFLQIFGKDLDDPFKEAYIRGFFEGNYIRNKDKK